LVPFVKSFVAGPKVIPPHISGLLLTNMVVSITGGLAQFLVEIQKTFLEREVY